MSLLQAFLKSYTNVLPRITNLASKMEQTNNLIINYPLALSKTPTNRYTLYSQSKITKGNDLLLLSAAECFFSTGLSGSNPSEQKQINEQFSLLSKQYEFMNSDFIERMKIYIQLLANSYETRKGDMPMKEYSEYVLGSNEMGIAKADINSRFLLQLYQSWEINNRVMYGYLKKELLKRTEEQDFLNACSKGKMVIRNTGDQPFKFSAPFIDKLDHSFTPNCEFELLYLPHRRSPFVRIKSTRDIAAGEKPTLNYGKLNNYELLLRYGFTVKDNPHRIFMLPLSFQTIVEIFNKNIDWKQQMFAKNNLKLKNYVKLLPNGQISPDDLRMMRILINDTSKPLQQDTESPQSDALIYQFIGEHAKGLRKNIKINTLKTSSDAHIRTLEDEEVCILETFLSKHKV